MSREKAYRCLYNHELLILFTSQTPYQAYRENVRDAQAVGMVRELADTQVDALMCCPQAWMTPAYFSDVDRKWQDEAPLQVEPLPESDWKYFEKAYYRMRRYMLQGKDPVALSLSAARDIGLDFFLSYRMNEAHYLNFPECPTHSRFWRENPQYRIRQDGTGSPLNYLVPEVRDRYLAILAELVQRYDIDGFELDFMRSCRFFPQDQIEEGRGAMTAFVRQVRTILDGKRGRRRRLALSVRVPHTLERCLAAGLDPVAWDRESLIDLVNVSPHFRTTLELDIAGFRRELRNARVHGEMHFITQAGQTSSGYTNNINRRTNRTIYETCALSFLDRGADGLSFFNFAYTRDHSFNEPRRREYPGVEPPFDVLRTVCDEDYLRQRPKQYAITPGFDLMPVRLASPSGEPRDLRLHVADRLGSGSPFTRALLRLEADRPAGLFDIDVTLNGHVLQRISGGGELFPPLSAEGLPAPDRLAFYAVPLSALTYGANRIALVNRTQGEYSKGGVTIDRIELGLFTGD